LQVEWHRCSGRGGGDRLILIGRRTKHAGFTAGGGVPMLILGLCAEHRVELFGLEAS